MPKIHQRVVNPHRKTKSAAARGPRHSRRRRLANPLGGGELILATMGNPRRGSHRNPRHSKRRNPSLDRPSRRHSRRNPRGIGHFTLGEVGKVSIGAAAGSLAAPAITQMVLGDKNTGAMGYLANAAVALTLGFGAAQFLEPTWALGIAAGGIGSTILRVWQERVSMTSPSALSGLGDLNFSSNGMGAFVQTPFALPSVSKKNGPFQVVQDPWTPALPAPAGPTPAQVSPATAAAKAAAPANTPAQSLHGTTARFSSRFA